MKGIMLQDGIIRTYLTGYYTAEDDHTRAIYGAYIIGYLEACFDLGEWVDEHLKKDGIDRRKSMET